MKPNAQYVAAMLVATACSGTGPLREPAASTSQPALASTPSYTLFESGQVRPLAISPGGKLLHATNTPDNRLEIFRILPNTTAL
jgi:hypothetical protein